MATDLLVKLYEIQEDPALLRKLEGEGIRIKRLLPADLRQMYAFIVEHFHVGWADEAQTAAMRDGCYIATREGHILGFACIEAMRDYFGPTGVLESERGKGVGKALLLRSLVALRERGYAYAIIGYVGDAVGFYQKTIGAIEIPESFPGHYENMIQFP